MAIWKEQNAVKRDYSPLSGTGTGTGTAEAEAQTPADLPPAVHDTVRRAPDRKNPESVISAGLTIEGTIAGVGDVRIAGQFHGDVHVQGSLTIESGAKLIGGVRASTVIIDGELEGNIDAASRVELHATGVLNGNLNTGSLTVAAGSRMRGQVEFGWNEHNEAVQQPHLAMEHEYAQ